MTTRRALVGLLAGVLGLGAMAAERSIEGAKRMTETIRRLGLAFQVGRSTLPPDRFELSELLASVERYNTETAQPGLPAELNVEQLDPERVAAFVAGIEALPESSRSLLRGATLRLNFQELQLHRWSPVTAEQLRRGYQLEADPVNHNPSLAALRLLAPLDTGRLERQMAAAQAAVAERDPALSRLATASSAQALAEAGRIRRERHSAAMVWLALARQWQQLDPAARPRQDAVAAARAALAAHPVTSASGGMP